MAFILLENKHPDLMGTSYIITETIPNCQFLYRPGQSSLSAGALRYRAWAQSWSSVALAPTPVFLLGESHGQRSLAGYSHRVAKNQT